MHCALTSLPLVKDHYEPEEHFGAIALGSDVDFAIMTVNGILSVGLITLASALRPMNVYRDGWPWHISYASNNVRSHPKSTHLSALVANSFKFCYLHIDCLILLLKM